jgi:hypothetical protein
MDSLRGGFDSHPLIIKSRADRVVSDILARYNFTAPRLKPDHTIELICCFQGLEISPDSLGTRDGDIVCIGVRTLSHGENEIERRDDFFVPVEQLAFRITISNKKSDKPPKEIGFHAISDESKDR